MRTAGISNRFRYLLRGSYALNDAKDFGFTGYDEVMFTLNDVMGSFPSGYERNRSFIGPYWLVNNARYEIGYLAEHLQHFGSEERWAHAIVATASYNF